MHSFNVHFAQARRIMTIENKFERGFIEALHIKTPFCTKKLIPKDRLAIFTNYQSVTKDQALEETILILFHPVVKGFFQLVSVTIEDTITRHDVIKG